MTEKGDSSPCKLKALRHPNDENHIRNLKHLELKRVGSFDRNGHLVLSSFSNSPSPTRGWDLGGSRVVSNFDRTLPPTTSLRRRGAIKFTQALSKQTKQNNKKKSTQTTGPQPVALQQNHTRSLHS